MKTTQRPGGRFDLDRFVAAQAGVLGPEFARYDQALRELRAGRKQTHWMWYVFPQMRGLGASEGATHYGIESLDEARAYLRHPLLGPRLHECVEVVLSQMKKPEETFGVVDAAKFRSCLTLFREAAAPGSVFARAWQVFGGDEMTTELLARQDAAAWEAFLERSKVATFPRSEELAAQVAAGEILTGGRTGEAIPASALCAALRQRIDRLASLTCPEAGPYRRELVAMHARAAERPHAGSHVWSLVLRSPGSALVSWRIYEWEDAQGFLYGCGPETPAAAHYARWALDHPPGLHELNPPWATGKGDPWVAHLSFNDRDDQKPLPFWHAFGRLSAEDRSRWVAMHPAPPEWREWLEFLRERIDRWTQAGHRPATTAWLHFIEGGNEEDLRAPSPARTRSLRAEAG